jgi:gamma-glutamyltranspeptidase/glutathione hydrolase
MDEYQELLVDDATADEIRGKILDYRTQNPSAYDPEGLESLET